MMYDIIYAGVPLARRRRPMDLLARWLSRSPKVPKHPEIVPRDDRSVLRLENAYLALPDDTRIEVRERLMQAIVTFERTKDVAPVIEFMQSLLITAQLNSNPQYRSALKDAEAESCDEPGVDVGVMIAAANERRRAAQEQTR